MLVEKAYLDLYPKAKLGEYEFSLYYSGKFNDYNANVKRVRNRMDFNLSKKWKQINEDVKVGLIQTLLNKILKTNVQTQNMELYEIFLKKIHIAVPKVYAEPLLVESFSRINNKYFYGLIEQPNLCWGRDSFQKLGSYEYGSDSITISSLLKNADLQLLDFIMYHEMLHKKHKFYTKGGRSRHHTSTFKREERQFENYKEMERRIDGFIKKKRLFRLL